MKSLVLVIATFLIAASAAQAQRGPRGGKIEWRTDYEQGLRDARQDGRPVLLYFTADW